MCLGVVRCFWMLGADVESRGLQRRRGSFVAFNFRGVTVLPSEEGGFMGVKVEAFIYLKEQSDNVSIGDSA